MPLCFWAWERGHEEKGGNVRSVCGMGSGGSGDHREGGELLVGGIII